MPVGVGGFDKLDFPVSFPGFHLLFTVDGGNNGIAVLVPDKELYIVFSCEAGDKTGLVLVDSPDQVASDTNVERAAFAAGEYVNVRHRYAGMGPSFRWDDDLLANA